MRELQGKPGHGRPINRKAPNFSVLRDVPPAPSGLGEKARETWDEYAPMLVETGVLTRADLQVLRAFCDAVEVWWECVRDVQANGSVLEAEGKLIRNPAGIAKDAAWKTIRECSALLGLDPSSRSRIVVDAPKTEENRFKTLGVA